MSLLKYQHVGHHSTCGSRKEHCSLIVFCPNSCSLVLVLSNIIMFTVLLCMFPGWYPTHSCNKRHVLHPSFSHHWVGIAMSNAGWGIWAPEHYVILFPLGVFILCSHFSFSFCTCKCGYLHQADPHLISVARSPNIMYLIVCLCSVFLPIQIYMF